MFRFGQIRYHPILRKSIRTGILGGVSKRDTNSTISVNATMTYLAPYTAHLAPYTAYIKPWSTYLTPYVPYLSPLLEPIHPNFPFAPIDVFGAMRLSSVVNWMASGAFDPPVVIETNEKGKKAVERRRPPLLRELLGLMIVVFGAETFLGMLTGAPPSWLVSLKIPLLFCITRKSTKWIRADGRRDPDPNTPLVVPTQRPVPQARTPTSNPRRYRSFPPPHQILNPPPPPTYRHDPFPTRKPSIPPPRPIHPNRPIRFDSILDPKFLRARNAPYYPTRAQAWWVDVCRFIRSCRHSPRISRVDWTGPGMGNGFGSWGG